MDFIEEEHIPHGFIPVESVTNQQNIVPEKIPHGWINLNNSILTTPAVANYGIDFNLEAVKNQTLRGFDDIESKVGDVIATIATPSWVWILVAILSVVAVIAVLGLIYCYCQGRKSKKRSSTSDPKSMIPLQPQSININFNGIRIPETINNNLDVQKMPRGQNYIDV